MVSRTTSTSILSTVPRTDTPKTPDATWSSGGLVVDTIAIEQRDDKSIAIPNAFAHRARFTFCQFERPPSQHDDGEVLQTTVPLLVPAAIDSLENASDCEDDLSSCESWSTASSRSPPTEAHSLGKRPRRPPLLEVTINQDEYYLETVITGIVYCDHVYVESSSPPSLDLSSLESEDEDYFKEYTELPGHSRLHTWCPGQQVQQFPIASHDFNDAYLLWMSIRLGGTNHLEYEALDGSEDSIEHDDSVCPDGDLI